MTVTCTLLYYFAISDEKISIIDIKYYSHPIAITWYSNSKSINCRLFVMHLKMVKMSESYKNRTCPSYKQLPGMHVPALCQYFKKCTMEMSFMRIKLVRQLNSFLFMLILKVFNMTYCE